MEAPSSPDRNQPRIIGVDDERIFLSIETGQKTLELRVGFNSFSRIKPGDILEFRTRSKKIGIKAKVKETRKYKTLEEVTATEDVEKIAPSMSREELNKISARTFKEQDVKKYGLIVIDFEKIEEYDEKKLEEEMAASYARSEKYYEEQLARSDLEPGQAQHLLEQAAQLASLENNSVAAFISFTNNFFSKFPGGRQWGDAAYSKQERKGKPKGREMEQWEMDELRIHDDLMELLKELLARPEFVAQISNIRKMRDIDPGACDLMKKVYIGMRNKGHAHSSLYS
ncbi:MAG: hypothetical protein M3M85_01785 [bacterium]|nr:hypothetical protein [bacterium]